MTSWLNKYSTYEEVIVGSANSIVALIGGGQTLATPLTAKFNSVDTCATDYNSVKLDSALIGKMQNVFNNTGQILSVYPVSGQTINGIVNYEFRIGPGDNIEFKCFANGKWKTPENSL